MSVLFLVTAAFAYQPPVVQPASFATSQSESPAENTDADPVNQNISAYYDAMYDDNFQQALEAAKRLSPDPENREGTAIVTVMRASALLGLKQEKEARQLIEQAERLAPQEPDVLTTLFLGSILAEHYEVAAETLDRMIARAPDKVREQDIELMWHFLRNEPKDQKARNEDRRVALARIGYGGDSAYGDSFAGQAIEILAKRGNFDGARELLGYLDEPRSIEDLLIQRRYAALWPALEAHAGPHLEKVRASSVRTAEKAYAADPDAESLQLYINALRMAGRHAEAIAMTSKLPASPEAMSEATEDMGWAINNVALAMYEAGRADDADRLFKSLNEAPMKREYWRVSMKINRLELLVADGKYAEALPLLEPTAKTPGSPYAEQLVRRLCYCTLSGLGRRDEAAKHLSELLTHAKDAPGPTIDGLVCAGQLDEAEKLALESLKDERFHEDFVRSLQARPLTSDDPSVWQKGWQALRSRPAIAAEFDRLGRDMPDAFLPPPRR